MVAREQIYMMNKSYLFLQIMKALRLVININTAREKCIRCDEWWAWFYIAFISYSNTSAVRMQQGIISSLEYLHVPHFVPEF